MSPKSTVFLSVTLTAFVMAILFSVVSRVANSSAAPATAAPTSTASAIPNTATATLEEPTDAPTATLPSPLTHDEAATLAAAAIKRQDVYSVENFKYQGVDSFKVVFSSGDTVYIGLDRQVLAMTKPSPVAVIVSSTQAPKKRRTTGGGGSGSSSSSAAVSPPPAFGGEPGDD